MAGVSRHAKRGQPQAAPALLGEKAINPIQSSGGIYTPARGEKDHRVEREGHGTIFLVGLLFAALMGVAALIAIEFAPMFQATVPSEPLKSEQTTEGE